MIRSILGKLRSLWYRPESPKKHRVVDILGHPTLDVAKREYVFARRPIPVPVTLQQAEISTKNANPAEAPATVHLTTRNVSRVLVVTQREVCRLIAKGCFPDAIRGPRGWLVPLRNVLDYKQASSSRHVERPPPAGG